MDELTVDELEAIVRAPYEDGDGYTTWNAALTELLQRARVGDKYDEQYGPMPADVV